MTLADRLLALWAALQQPTTTFAQVCDLSAECGLNPGAVLRHHFETQRAVLRATLEA